MPRARPAQDQQDGTGDPRQKATSSVAEQPAVDPAVNPTVNTVRLVGRVSAEPEHRELPSGDQLVQLRVVVPRPPRPPRPVRPSRGTGGSTAAKTAEAAGARNQVDTIDVTCWTAGTRRTASRLEPGQLVEFDGALRRRFFRSGAATQSRYEVEVARLRKLT